MKCIDEKQVRILAVAPSTKGCGFAVLEAKKLVDWGVKAIGRDKNAQSLLKVKELIQHYQPTVVALQDTTVDRPRRCVRIQQLILSIATMAQEQGLNVKFISRRESKSLLLGRIEATKHEVATFVAELFPHELGSRLPPKRQPWKSEDYRMPIFDAVALALATAASPI